MGVPLYVRPYDQIVQNEFYNYQRFPYYLITVVFVLTCTAEVTLTPEINVLILVEVYLQKQNTESNLRRFLDICF
jgi:hypothetical protein